MVAGSKPRASALARNHGSVRRGPFSADRCRRTRSASARPQPVSTSMMRSTCSWKTTTPPVSASASRSFSCGKRGCASPCLTLQERADHVRVDRAGAEQRDVHDQVSHVARGQLADQLALAGRLDLEAADRVAASGSSRRWPRRRGGWRPGRRVSSLGTADLGIVCAIADCIRTPSTSSLITPAISASSLSRWLSGNPSALRWTAVRSSSVGVGQQHPARVHGDVAGQAVELFGDAEEGGQLRRGEVAGRSSGSSARAVVMCRARMCGKALAIAPISSGGSDIAAATSLIALRAR